MTIRVMLPQHLRTLAHVGAEVSIEIEGPATLRSALDALETAYPMYVGRSAITPPFNAGHSCDSSPAKKTSRTNRRTRRCPSLSCREQNFSSLLVRLPAARPELNRNKKVFTPWQDAADTSTLFIRLYRPIDEGGIASEAMDGVCASRTRSHVNLRSTSYEYERSVQDNPGSSGISDQPAPA